MAAILTDLGEEYTLETALSGVSLTVGLYDDSTDAISDTNDIADITTEPNDGNYVRQTITIELADVSGNWTARNSAAITFDVTNTTGSVDSYFIVANFTADDTGDAGATDHLIATGSLSQIRDLSQIDTLNVSAGSVGYSIT